MSVSITRVVYFLTPHMSGINVPNILFLKASISLVNPCSGRCTPKSAVLSQGQQFFGCGVVDNERRD